MPELKNIKGWGKIEATFGVLPDHAKKEAVVIGIDPAVGEDKTVAYKLDLDTGDIEIIEKEVEGD